jgi:DNA-binding XRE family transcriptional regulator
MRTTFSESELHCHIIHYRIIAGFPALALADRVGISRSNLYRIERNLVTPSISTVFKIAKVLRVRVDDLFTLEEMNERELEAKLADYFAKLVNRRYSFKRRYMVRHLLSKSGSF